MGQFTNIVLLLSLVTFFYVSAVAVPSVAADFDVSSTIVTSNIQNSTIDEGLRVAQSGNVNPFDVYKVTVNMLKLAFIGQIGGLPAVFDIFYTVLAIAIVFLSIVCFVPTIGGGA